jgi:hypothetical protein
MLTTLPKIVIDSFNDVIEVYHKQDMFHGTNDIEGIIKVLYAIRKDHPLSKILSNESITVLKGVVFANVLIRDFVLEYANYLALEAKIQEINTHDVVRCIVEAIAINTSITSNALVDKRLLIAYQINLEATTEILNNNFWLVALFLLCYYWNKTSLANNT